MFHATSQIKQRLRALNAIKRGLYKTSQSLKVRKIQFWFDLGPSKTKTLYTSFASTLISYCTQFFVFCFVLFFLFFFVISWGIGEVC